MAGPREQKIAIAAVVLAGVSACALLVIDRSGLSVKDLTPVGPVLAEPAPLRPDLEIASAAPAPVHVILAQGQPLPQIDLPTVALPAAVEAATEESETEEKETPSASEAAPKEGETPAPNEK